jgi:hypothetical protein
MMDWLRPIIEEQPYPHVFVTISGAHLYGFPSVDSDYDLRGVHLLPTREVVGLRKVEDTLTWMKDVDGTEVDLVTHDAEKFFRLLLKRNGYVLEQVFSPLVVKTSPAHTRLKAIAMDCVTVHHGRHYLGFSRNQWALFKKKTPHEVKPLLYTFRVLLTGIHLMRTGEVEANLNHLNDIFGLSYLSDLIAQKSEGPEKAMLWDGNVDFYASEVSRLTMMLENAMADSSLPNTPSGFEDLNALLVALRLADGVEV